MKILKFGGSSLATPEHFEQVKSIIQNESDTQRCIVLSAIGNTTNLLEEALTLATKRSVNYHKPLADVFELHRAFKIDLSEMFNAISNQIEGIYALGDYTPKVKAELLSFGELLACRLFSTYLNSESINNQFIDSRHIIRTNSNYLEAEIDIASTAKNIETLEMANHKWLPILPGFIGSNQYGDTTTFGRNGSNLTASLLASLLKADEVQIWTDVNGLFTCDPTIVPDAQIIPELSYEEAEELANTGTRILFRKSIAPLIEQQIPIRIKNTQHPNLPGTTIHHLQHSRAITAISVENESSLISIEGNGLLDKIGIDGRIFSALSKESISVKMISQTASERSIGFVVNSKDAEQAFRIIEQEFEKETHSNTVTEVLLNKQISIVSVVGSGKFGFYDVFNALKTSGIKPLLIANAINGKQISVVLDSKHVSHAARTIHKHIFNAAKVLNVAIFGNGAVGSTLIKQIQSFKNEALTVNVFAIANSQGITFQPNLKHVEFPNSNQNPIDELIAYTNKHHLENLIFADVTASKSLVLEYGKLVKQGFNIVAANKIANTQEFSIYKELRTVLQEERKQFLYETNVGAWLPLIETIRKIYRSGDKIRSVRGVFSGSLSYIFNRFSLEDKPFEYILNDAVSLNYTEPDPREDLSGNDVARKLLILAREVGQTLNIEDISVEKLLLPQHEALGKEEFLEALSSLSTHFEAKKNSLSENQVLRYIGEFSSSGEAIVTLIPVEKSSAFGQLSGSDVLVEIYTDWYQDRPLVVQGAGAGREVTAGGVLSDILSIGESIR